jgi:hypothetical protein
LRSDAALEGEMTRDVEKDTGRRTLVVVPCGKAKIWDKAPDAGPTAAMDAYVGTPFKLNRQYAERVGDAWVVMSARHGLLRPEDAIDGPYNVTFKRRGSGPITPQAIREQLLALGFDEFERVIGLGGIEYRRVLKEAFAGLSPRIEFPFEGLPLGEALHKTKLATERTSRTESP